MRPPMVAGRFLSLVCVMSAVAQPATARAAEQLLAPPTEAHVRQAALTWLQSRAATPELRQAVEAQWDFHGKPTTADDRFDALIRTFYLVDSDARALVDACREGQLVRLSQGFPVLDS